MEKKYSDLVEHMTTDEKITLVSGLDFSYTREIERLNIPAIKLSDGPHGVRAQNSEGADHLGLGASDTATCFPSGAALASSWNTDMIAKVATAIGMEARHYNINVILGPAFNIKRSPLCGRSFEYFSEDPFLSGKLAAAYIRAIQSVGVAACPKHFAANNQEDLRMITNSVIEERALREIYLTAFEIAVKEGEPWAIMSAYNRLNGIYCSENSVLLTDILRDEWGFDGAVVSDFGAVSHRGRSLAAGMDLEMPGTGIFSDTLVERALADGSLDERDLDICATRVAKLIDRTANVTSVQADMESHHQLAQQVAEECIVLLKNDGQLLPLQSSGKVGIIGALAKQPRYQGGGSSHVESWKVDSIWELASEAAGGAEIRYAAGYDIEEGNHISRDILEQAKDVAKWADIVLLFVGLTEQYETEGKDRDDMQLPPAHQALIRHIANANRPTAVVVSAGAPIEMPWINEVDAVIYTYTAGDGMGKALVNIIWGHVNPSGKLAESLPEKVEHTSAYLNFRESKADIRYTEGVFVGYRNYEKTGRKPMFAFGHGMSYTSFQYSNLRLSSDNISENDTLTVSVLVENKGKMRGKEIVQLYVADCESSIPRPVKELKNFSKIDLDSGERARIEFVLDRRAFAFYDQETGDWAVESGDFEILVGASSADIRCRATVHVTAPPLRPLVQVTEETTLGQLVDCQATYHVICELLSRSPLYRPAEMENPPEFLRNLPLWTLNHASGVQITPEDLDAAISRLNASLAEAKGKVK